MNELHGGSEGLSRADKINRIKNSIRPDDIVPEVPHTEPVSASGDSDWERNITRILEKKSSEPKSAGGNTAESILAEIFGEEAVRRAPEPVEVSQPVKEVLPEPVVVPEPVKEILPEPAAVPKPVKELLPEPEPEVLPEEKAAVTEAAAEEVSGKKKKENKKKKEQKSAEGTPRKKKKKKTLKQRFLGLFPQKGDSVLEVIRKIVFLISIIAIVVCGYLVGDYYFELWQSKKVTEEVSNLYWTYETTEPAAGEEHPSMEPVEEGKEKPVYKLLPGAKKLLDMNKDVIGYIKIDGTPVDNVVLRGEDNFVYLDKKINGAENRAGELFLDWRCHFDDVDEEGHLKYGNSQNLVIYGHAMKDESMFGSLIKYRTTDSYYSDHPVIYLNSNYSHYTYKIFSVFILDAEDKSETKFDCWDKFNFQNEIDFYNFVNEAKRRNIRLNDVDVKYGDQLLTLSTCDTYLGDRGRLIIMARRVREGEDAFEGTQNSTLNPNIKWPTMYYNSKSGKYDPEDFVPYNAPDEEEKPKSETTAAAAATAPTATTQPETKASTGV
ncbi:MAG: class B sortase [Ruminococcus sp.]|nr:class B sortase [Ruminococcus sp.]